MSNPTVTPVLTDLTLADLERSEADLKASMFAVGRAAGRSDEAIQADWDQVEHLANMFVLACQFGDDPRQDIYLTGL
jgi:hypothetical protein